MVLVRSLLGAELLRNEQVGLPVQVDTSGFDPAAFARVTATAARRAEADGTPLYTALVPTQLARILDGPAAGCLTAYHSILVGAAATPQQLLDRAAGAGARVVTTYGMSETCGGCVYDGRPLDGVAITLGSGGRVLVGGPTLFSGYRLRPDLSAEAFDAAGHLRTADHGELSADGSLRVLGRLDDVIVSGGENVVPALVEDALMTLPEVAGAVVVGLPDPEWGERVVAVVETRDGSGLRVSDVRARLAAQLPAAALPRALHLAAALPLLATGKPDRAAVRALALARSAAGGDAAVGAVAARPEGG
jgi:O-succinylbenzoic acid--CoA ligase